MNIDYIDLYQVHWPDEQTPFEETAGYLQEMVDEGKLRHVGVSNFDVPQMEAFERGRPVETLQPPYHLFRRSDAEETIWPYVGPRDIGVLVYSPLGSGLLTGTMTEDTTFDADDWRSQGVGVHRENLRTNLRVVDELKKFAAHKGGEVSQLAIAWVLAQPEVDVAIVGRGRTATSSAASPPVDIELDGADLARSTSITMNWGSRSWRDPGGGARNQRLGDVRKPTFRTHTP